MSALRKIIDGLTIIERVNPNAFFAAEHDEIHASTLGYTLSAEDEETLKKLDWRQSNEAKTLWRLYV